MASRGLRPASALAVIAAAASGCHDAAQLSLAPLGCLPEHAAAIKITAYTASGEQSQFVSSDETVAISFPPDTEQLGVAVQVGGGDTGAAGKSAPLDYGALADGTKIPVFLAPPSGFCATGAMTEPRKSPRVARAGAGALVLGGTGPDGPVTTAEYYDPTTATFVAVPVPDGLAEVGLTGMALATMPDGRVAVSGNSAFAVFDPARRAFTSAPVLIQPYVDHASIALDADHVLFAGGCAPSAITGGCGPRRQVVSYQLSDPTSANVDLPLIGDTVTRLDGRLFDEGEQPDGVRRFVLAGGSSPDLVQAFALADAATTPIAGGHAQATALDGGAVLTGFDGVVVTDPQTTDAVSILAFGMAPGVAPAFRAATPSLLRPGVRVITFEDGLVGAFGGGNVVATYDPTQNLWHDGAPGPTLDAPSLVRLDDGAILVVGGALTTDAYLYRPSLIGPASGSVTAVPVSGLGGAALTAPDPATVTRTTAPAASWQLAAPTGEPDTALTARALVGGPRIATGSVSAVVHVTAGGLALIARQVAPGHLMFAELVPGVAPRLVTRAAGADHVVCTGDRALDPFKLSTTVQLAVTDHDAAVTIDGAAVLSCAVPAPDARGAWGIASRPAGGAGAVNVDSVTVAR